MTGLESITVCRFDELPDPGCREFRIGGGDWPFRGFVVRRGERVFAYENVCAHAGHPLNWKPDSFLTEDSRRIVCASHGAIYQIESGECVGGPCVGKKLRQVEVDVVEGEVVVRGPDSQS